MGVLAKHTAGKGGPDKNFLISGMAKERAAVVGKENIVNAAVGSFLDDQGRLITMKTVEDTVREIPFYETADYASIEGSPGFLRASIDAAFREYRPDAYIGGVATPGGTGGIHLAVLNYLDDGDTALTQDRYWVAYKGICREANRKFETFATFDADGRFHVQACIEKLRQIAEQQTNVFLILNTPANNPTGYNIKMEEWEALLAELKAIAGNGRNNVVLLLDIAYIDYAAPEERAFFRLFDRLPENFLVLVAFSMSKSYAMYGYRLGCLLCLSSSEEEVEKFVAVSKFSSRATWSNCSRLGMLVMEAIYNDPEKKAAFRAEQEQLRMSLLRRADIFMREAKQAGLAICPFDAGFFVTVPTRKAEAVAAELRKSDIFVVPLGDDERNAGVRIAICAIPEQKLAGIPGKIRQALDQVQG